MIKKTRPGAYIDFKSNATNLANVSERGIVLLPIEADFLPVGEFLSTSVYTDFLGEYGISINDESMICVNEALKNAETVLIYRVNSGVKATKTVGSLVATAKCEGAYGNRISFEILQSGSGNLLIIYVDDEEVLEVYGESLDVINENNFITFTGELQTATKTLLAGGSTTSATEAMYNSFFTEARVLEFNTFAITKEDVNLHNLAFSFTKTMRENEGKKIQCVLANATGINYEGVINVTNGVVLANGIQITPNIATAYVAGAVAGSAINESLTYSEYIGAVDALPKLTSDEISDKLENGEFIFTYKRGKVIIEQDINSFTEFSPTKGSVFAKNRIVRILDNIATDIKALFEDYYLGKVSNNDEGRSLFAAECINYLRNLEQMACIEDFKAMEDILVYAGDDVDSVHVSMNIKPIDSIEKLYMTVVLN